VIKNSS